MSEIKPLIYPWHQAVLSHVTQQMRAGRLPHAVLYRQRPDFFDTTLGWQIVQRLLCDSHTANDHCQHCRLMAEKTHPNVFFLDVHHEKIGINEVRQLEQQMWQTAVFDKPKIAFISGIDLLSIAAQNALLKTLEEPPKNVFFILSVDNISQVLPTIMSRVQRLRHPAIDTDEQQAMLNFIHQQMRDAHGGASLENVSSVAALADFAPERILVLLAAPEQVSQLTQEKKLFAQFIAGNYSAAQLTAQVDTNDIPNQLSRYQSYVDSLIKTLFDKTVQNKSHDRQTSVKYIQWKGVSLRRLYQLRDALADLTYLQVTNTNFPMQFNDYLSRWQNEQT